MLIVSSNVSTFTYGTQVYACILERDYTETEYPDVIEYMLSSIYTDDGVTVQLKNQDGNVHHDGSGVNTFGGKSFTSRENINSEVQQVRDTNMNVTYILSVDYVNLNNVTLHKQAVQITTGIMFTHPNGKSWKLDGNNIRLNTGIELLLDIYDNSSASGFIGLYKNEGSITNDSVNHQVGTVFSGNRVFVNSSHDFVWKLLSENNGDTYKIYNGYGSNYYIGYDNVSDEVKIMRGTPVEWTTNKRISDLFVYS